MRIKHIFYFVMLWILSLQVSIAQNIAHRKPVKVSSENPRYPESLIVDGGISKSSTWIPTNDVRPPQWAEINLKKYYEINKIVLYNGIPENEMSVREKEKAAGFYCIKNLKFQYWDDANWTDFPNTELVENRKSVVTFWINPSVTTYKVRLISTDGEPIRIVDIQIFGQEKGEVFSSDIDFEPEDNPGKKEENQAQVEIKNNIIGHSMKYVGYNQGYYMPGSNISGWLEYSGINSLRVWTSLSQYIPDNAVDLKQTVDNLSRFDEMKKLVTDNPESNPYIRWDIIKDVASNEVYSTNSMVFDYALSELKRLGIDVVLQINSTDFTGDWQNKWDQWLKFYALAYYASKTGDVEMYAMHNEPNHAHANMKLDQYIDALKIVSDAVRCAVSDVNRLYGKNLKCKIVSPVTAGTNTNWWSSVIASVRTDYKGKTIDYDLLDIFSTHSYNIPAIGYTNKVDEIRSLLIKNHPLQKEIPIVFTEIGRWMNAYLIDREETMDSPSLFTEWAGIYANNMNNGGYGMWAFKLANTASETYTRGIKSGHHHIWKGTRFLEDSQDNLALGKPVKTNAQDANYKASYVTDGDKSDESAWLNSSDGEKWIEIDLQTETELGGAVVYTGSSYGVFTSPDRIKNFKLQAWNGTGWHDIDGAAENKSKYAQVLWEFKKPVLTNKVRLLIQDEGTVKVREVKLFAKDFMGNADKSFDISGIQRTGEVVRLFAKGFKNEKPLLKTNVSVGDLDMNINTSYDEKTQTYYIWLVNRNKFDYELNFNLSDLKLSPASNMFVEEVSSQYYGELVEIKSLSDIQSVRHKLPAQSVQLISIPIKNGKNKEIIATADAGVRGGKYVNNNYNSPDMPITLDSRSFDNNSVAYIRFDLGKKDLNDLNKCILSVVGYNSTDTVPYRLHVYAIPDKNWDEKSISWKNAPDLSQKEGLLMNVGTRADVAGELVFNHQVKRHELDVTNIVKRRGSSSYTFILIREPRELGDDYDKGRKCIIYSKESEHKPILKIF